VGILRAGRLAEIGTLAELRHLAAVSVEATFAGAVPDLTGIPGVRGTVVEDHRVRCQVQGPIKPLLRALADVEVIELLSREPSLEELFLAHYGPGTDAAPSAAAAGEARDAR
jgi:ABC-2 type transport system ATP-binding protein